MSLYKFSKCIAAVTLSFLDGPLATSYSAETYAILYSLEGGTSYSLLSSCLQLPLFSTFLATYLLRIGRTEIFSCSNCDSKLWNIFHLALDYQTLDSLRLAIFGHSLTILDLFSRPLGLLDYWDSTELIRTLIPKNKLSKLTTTTTTTVFSAKI